MTLSSSVYQSELNMCLPKKLLLHLAYFAFFISLMVFFCFLFRIASIYVIYQCWRERKDTIDGIYGTTTLPPNNAATSVISGATVARSASRISNRPANMDQETNGKNSRTLSKHI